MRQASFLQKDRRLPMPSAEMASTMESLSIFTAWARIKEPRIPET
ncbi:uncharacterized protein METZ01_LOCUS451067 [marine metagenome]|uniref:Uncharacterized protein n=1 Tax=marine metagenome TaxID=408172 RepID=A0A382ZS13_9ZZZZ